MWSYTVRIYSSGQSQYLLLSLFVGEVQISSDAFFSKLYG